MTNLKIKKYKPLTTFFLSVEKRKSIKALTVQIKDLYKSYDKGSYKRERLKHFSQMMWNTMQNEFFHTADISDNTIWEWQDTISDFDEYGYLSSCYVEKLEPWTEHMLGWYDREWAHEVLKLIKDFNLDNQPLDYVTVFKNDFMKVKSEHDFCAALLKWNDLIYWHPEKLALYDDTFQQPLNSHYDDEFNDDVTDEEETLNF